MWVVEGTVKEDLLKPLGLVCHGGGSKDGEMTYRIFSITRKNNFEVELKERELKNIEKIYNTYLRKQKLERIRNG